MSNRYLTKSRFVLALDCPTKLYYAGKKEYANSKEEDSFLEGLAENGYQVAELARCYHPDGITVEAINDEEALKKTSELLQIDNVTVFEAAIRYKNLFLRTDILIKNGNSIKLIEVKSKSFNSNDKSPFMTKKGGIYSIWKPYIYDISFQKYVLMNAFPEMNVSSYLMLADTSSISPSDGLNQKFRIFKDKNDRIKIITKSQLTADEISYPILKKVNVDEEVNYVVNNEKYNESLSFEDYVDYLSSHYENDIKVKPKPGSVCKKCEYRGAARGNLKSGFNECWNEIFSFSEKDCKSPMILDIWNLSLDNFIHAGVCRVEQISESDINIKSNDKPGLSASERKWLQIEKMKSRNNEIYIDTENLKAEMLSWVFPLHFIDFETIKPAIPFNKGEHPYHDLAFQFSHHVMYADGKIAHVGQYINKVIGKNPNLDFIRALKDNLEKDSGTIFRYATHENTYLNKIYNEINSSLEFIPDKDQILNFIKSISHSTDDSVEKWKGKRDMVDLRELVLRFYYDPMTFGSNSIKQVFPAILKRSTFLQNKYSHPIYGKDEEIPSLNFPSMQWVRMENADISDPYNLLPKLFQDIDLSYKELELLYGDDNIKGGGAASIAYSRLQFCEMNDLERNEIISALLKYCELDTFAMVMIVEAWQDMLGIVR